MARTAIGTTSAPVQHYQSQPGAKDPSKHKRSAHKACPHPHIREKRSTVAEQPSRGRKQNLTSGSCVGEVYKITIGKMRRHHKSMIPARGPQTKLKGNPDRQAIGNALFGEVYCSVWVWIRLEWKGWKGRCRVGGLPANSIVACHCLTNYQTEVKAGSWYDGHACYSFLTLPTCLCDRATRNRKDVLVRRSRSLNEYMLCSSAVHSNRMS